MLRLILLILMLSLVCSGQEQIEVIFVTEPAGAEISNGYGEYLGLTGEPVNITFEPRTMVQRFGLSKSGYATYQVAIMSQDLRLQTRFPEQGIILLKPTTFLTRIQSYGRRQPIFSVVVVGLLGYFLILYWRHRRLSRIYARRSSALGELASYLPSNDDRLFTVIGGYRLVALLRMGSTSMTYLAVPDESLEKEKQFVVKLQSAGNDEPASRKRLEREAHLSTQLSHPSLVPTIGYGIEDGRAFLVRRLVEGPTLEERLREGPLEVSEAISLFAAIADAVSYLHRRGCLHRNLKPSKIVLAESGPPRIIDLGFLTQLEPDKVRATVELGRRAVVNLVGQDQETRPNLWVGTLAYWAPELMAGGEHSPATEQFALGVVMYQALSGRLPSPETEFYKAMMSRVNDDALPLVELEEEPVAELVMKMLAREPKERFEDLQEVSERLRELAG